MVSSLLYVGGFIVEVVMDHWTDSSPQWAQAWHLGKEPLASASLSLLSFAPPNEPSTPLDARPEYNEHGTQSKEAFVIGKTLQRDATVLMFFISFYVYFILLICCVLQQNTNQLVLHCQFIFFRVGSQNWREK